MPVPAKRFYMIRHGQTEANAAQRMAGWLDSPLTDLGRQQADHARKKVEALEDKPQIIVHSQLSRARETAAIINTNLNLPMIEDEDYAEMHAGDWEGAPWEDCTGMFDDWQDPPGGETSTDFIDRVRRAKNKALAREEEPALIVCHGGVFRAFAKLYEIDIWGVENCQLHEFLPHPKNGAFPWRALHYTLDDRLNRRLSQSFHPDAAKT